jgi:hypothetical protein
MFVEAVNLVDTEARTCTEIIISTVTSQLNTLLEVW